MVLLFMIITRNLSIYPSTLNLSDVSEKDKPWDKHRKNSDVIANHYRGTEFDSYAHRMDMCGQVLRFQMVNLKNESKLKLVSANFCRVRYCQVCSWRRALV